MTISKEKRKKISTAIIGIVLVSLLCISITLAYLQSHTKEVINTFTLGEGVEVELEHDSGLNKDFSPGFEYDKPAIVKIPTTVMDWEYIAVKVEYYVEEQGLDGNLTLRKIEDNNTFLSSYAYLQSYQIDGSSDDIENALKVQGTRNGWYTEDNRIFYYGIKNEENLELTKVNAGENIVVFDQIKVCNPYPQMYTIANDNPILTKNGIDGGVLPDKSVSKIVKGQLETFHTVVTAYAVQGDISTEQAMEEFAFLLNNSN